MIDYQLHISDLLLAIGMAIGGWRMGMAFRDEIKGLRQTVYGSLEPPVEGLVNIVRRHDKVILELR